MKKIIYIVLLAFIFSSCVTVRMNEANREFEFFNNDVSVTVWVNNNRHHRVYEYKDLKLNNKVNVKQNKE